MKKWLTGCLLLGMTSVCSAQEQTLRDVFRQMPDSLMPTLTQNNRLDFLDFLDAGMKAEVKNRLGGTSMMTVLTADSLSLQMSPALRVDMLLLSLAEPIDSVKQVVVVGETFLTDSLYGETTVRYYTPDWHPVSVPPLSEIQQRRIEGLKLQTILNWSNDLLNKVKKER
jgi:hypothetical protein